MLKNIRHIALLFVLLIGVLGNVFAIGLVHDGSKISVVKSAVGVESIKAWEKLIDFASLRTNVNALEYVASPRTNKILVNVEEALGGHSIARHGNQIPLIEMEQRVLNTHPSMPQSRSALKFDSEVIHNDAVDKAFNHFKAEIKAHFDAGGGYRTWEPYDYGSRVGEGYHNYATLSNPTATYVTSKKLKLAFRPDPTHPDGFMLDSAYPFFEP